MRFSIVHLLIPANDTISRSFDLAMKEIQNAAERDAQDWAQLFDFADPRFVLQDIKTPPGSTLSLVCATWGGESVV